MERDPKALLWDALAAARLVGSFAANADFERFDREVESTYNWYWLIDGLQDAGFTVHLVNTAAVKQYDGLKLSGDFSDARHLAHLLTRIRVRRSASGCRRQSNCRRRPAYTL